MAKKENGNATKSFILRVDAEMMEAIEAWAADEFRSTNGQIQYILDQALRKAGRLKKKRILKSEEKNKELENNNNENLVRTFFKYPLVENNFSTEGYFFLFIINQRLINNHASLYFGLERRVAI